jgi:hypothetical protein
MVLLVYKTSALENRDEVVKIAMDIADCDYDFRRFRWGVSRSRAGQHRRHQDQKDGNTRAMGSKTGLRADHLGVSQWQAVEF